MEIKNHSPWEEIIFWLLASTVVLVPLAYNNRPYLTANNPKQAILLIIVSTTAAVWLLSKAASSWHLYWNPRLWLAILFLISVGLATIFSIDNLVSLYGSASRHQGFLAYLTYGGILFFASQINWSSQRLKMFSIVAGSTVLILGIHGILQYFDLDPLGLQSAITDSERVFSTFANPSIFSTYLVFGLLILFGLVFYSSGRVKWFWLIGFILTFVALLLTFSRGSWIAAFVGLAVFHLLSWKAIFNQWKFGLILLAMSALVIAGIFLYSATSEPETANLSTRAKSIFTVSQGSARDRLEIWQSAIAAVSTRPIFGFGPDTFRLFFPVFETDYYARTTGRNWLVDNAHNLWLQISSTMGLPTLLLFVVLIAIGLTELRGLALALPKIATLASGLFAAVVGYLTAVSFTINSLGVFFLIWIILGMALSARSSKVVFWNLKLSKFISFGLALLISAALVAGSVAYGIKPYLANSYFLSAKDKLVLGEVSQAVKLYRKSFYYDRLNSSYYWDGAEDVLDLARARKSLSIFKKAEGFYLEGIKANRLMLENYTLIGSAYLWATQAFKKPEYLREALRYLSQAVELAPRSGDAYFWLGLAYSASGDNLKAQSAFAKARSLNYKPGN